MVKQNQQTYANLIEGPVGRRLVSLTVPMIWGFFSLMAFNLVDTYFVARLGTEFLAAISFTFPVVMVTGGIAIGLGVGTSSLISRAIGEGNYQKVQKLTLNSLVLAVCIAGVFVVVGLSTIKPLFKMLGAKDDLIPLIYSYMKVWYIGVAFVVVPMVGNNAIRATGDTMTPAIIMTFAAVVNVILDPIIIFGYFGLPGLGLRGAALATVIARFTSFVFSLVVLRYRKRMLNFCLPCLSELVKSWREILYVSIPAAGTFMMVPFSTGIITNFVASFGTEAVAGFGIAIRMEGFALVIFMALSAAMGPFVGQNWGAKKYGRIHNGLNKSFIFAGVWGFLVFCMVWAFGKNLVSLFNPNDEVISIALMYLLIVSFSYGAEGIIFIASSAYNALGKSLFAALLVLTRAFILYVPLAYLGRKFGGVKGIFLAAGVSNFIVGLGAYMWILGFCKRAER